MASITRDPDTDGEANDNTTSSGNTTSLSAVANGAAAGSAVADSEERGNDEPGSPSGETPRNPDITVSRPDTLVSTNSDDRLKDRTEAMLKRLRGDFVDGSGGAGDAGSQGGSTPKISVPKGSLRDKRKDRRRRQGSNVSVASNLSVSATVPEDAPPVPPVPGLVVSPTSTMLTVPGADVGGVAETEKEGGNEKAAADMEDVLRAKNALLMLGGEMESVVTAPAATVTMPAGEGEQTPKVEGEGEEKQE